MAKTLRRGNFLEIWEMVPKRLVPSKVSRSGDRFAMSSCTNRGVDQRSILSIQWGEVGRASPSLMWFISRL